MIFCRNEESSGFSVDMQSSSYSSFFFFGELLTIVLLLCFSNDTGGAVLLFFFLANISFYFSLEVVLSLLSSLLVSLLLLLLPLLWLLSTYLSCVNCSNFLWKNVCSDTSEWTPISVCLLIPAVALWALLTDVAVYLMIGWWFLGTDSKCDEDWVASCVALTFRDRWSSLWVQRFSKNITNPSKMLFLDYLLVS